MACTCSAHVGAQRVGVRVGVHRRVSACRGDGVRLLGPVGVRARAQRVGVRVDGCACAGVFLLRVRSQSVGVRVLLLEQDNGAGAGARAQ